MLARDMARVTLLGAGMMGSALAVPLADRGHEVRLVGTHLDAEIIDSLKRTETHPKLGCELPREIRPYFVEELGEAILGAEILGVGVSSAGVRWAGEKLAPFVRPEVPIVMVTKGLELEEGRLVLLTDLLDRSFAEPMHPAAIAGPCIAGELARRVESCVLLAGRDRNKVERLAGELRAPYYHPFVSDDAIGALACAALKNAYAMGIAFALGLHEKRGGQPGSVAMHNTESAVFAQAVLEMQRIVEAMGGDPLTVSGLAGVGDLDVTTNGGRTGRFGRWLGLGLPVAEAIERMAGATLECLEILEVMRRALPGLGIGAAELPLLSHLCEVALDGAPVALPLSRFFR
jgi:glycerol-3-phosphate dehydrogenase (NAD(P)+)